MDTVGIPLRYVFAIALQTKQYEEVADNEPLLKKLVTVRAADGNGAVVLFQRVVPVQNLSLRRLVVHGFSSRYAAADG